VSILFEAAVPAVFFCCGLFPPLSSSPKSLKSIRPFYSLVSHLTLAFWPDVKLPKSSSYFLVLVVVWREMFPNPCCWAGWGVEREMFWPHDCCWLYWAKINKNIYLLVVGIEEFDWKPFLAYCSHPYSYLDP